MLPRLEIEYGWKTDYSRRQLTDDIKALEYEEGAPIARRRVGNVFYYKYTDPNYCYKQQVYQKQLLRLSQMIVILDELPSLPHQSDLIELRMRLQHYRNKVDDVHNQILMFKSLPFGRGDENVAPLYEAIAEYKAVTIQHERYHSNEPSERLVHPYSLVEYERHWYLFGYCVLNQCHRVFALDRIKSVQESGADYRLNEYPAELYFKDIVGVTRLPGEEVQDIELLVSKQMAPYFLSKPMHHSQYRINDETEDELHIGLRVMINPELIGKLLGYGREVRVLKSERLLSRMKEEVTMLSGMYGGDRRVNGVREFRKAG